MYDGMKRIGILVIVSLLITALLVPAPSSAQADQPEWEEGDVWAMGAEGDLEEIFAPAFDTIDEEFDPEEEEDLDEIDYDFEGEVGFYQIYEVVEANDDGYVMEMEAGGGIQASGSFEATGDMPKEGEYDIGEDPDTEKGTMSAEGELFFMLDIEGTVHYDADLAIEEIEMEYTLEFSAEFSVDNVPERDYENETFTVTHEDYSGGVSVEASLNLQMEFDPALDIFQFPFDEGDSWTAESMMTISGSYEGVIDVDYEDMPEEFQKEMEELQDELDQEFPIKLEEIDTEEEEMNFGEIEETTENVTIPMKCTGTGEVVLHDGETTDVYLLELGIDDLDGDFMMAQMGPAFQMMYSPEEGFIVSQRVEMDPEMEGMIGQFIDMEAMQMESMDPEKARESKEEAQEEEEEEDISGFTLALLGLGTVIAVAIYYKKEQ